MSENKSAPLTDHHQHLFSPMSAEVVSGIPHAILADDLLVLLDQAGIHKALVLSGAYIFGMPTLSDPLEYSRVQAENDWVAAQAGLYPDRLRAFCAFNPLKEYALDELLRCADNPHLRGGIKLHFGNSDVQLGDRMHLVQLQRVFQAANAQRMAIVVHLRAFTSQDRSYGETEARVFIEELLPLAPDIPVQVAHLAGTGPGYDDPPAQKVMAVLARAVERDDPRTDRLWFDVATVVDLNITPDLADLVARRIRQVGIERVLYGSDAAFGGNLRPSEGWAAFRRLPLREEEFTQIARQVAPYLL